MNITANIDYWGEGVATFDPEKVLDRLVEWFPNVIIDQRDYSQDEVEKVTEIVQEAKPEIKAKMIAQIKGKNRRNGPSFRFSFKSINGNKIDGHSRRYSVNFRSEKDIDDENQNRIVEFLKSLQLGEIDIK